MRDIGVGIIGTGCMGKAHGFAYRAVSGIWAIQKVIDAAIRSARERRWIRID